MSIEMKEVESSQIAKIGYDAESEELHIEFKKGGHYFYKSVPAEVYEEFSNAESIGSYFYRNIKGKYDHVKVQEEKAE
jgi:hypothetical protein